jgi:hypothetical protein
LTVKIKAWLMGAAALSALVLAGCSGGANISPITIGSHDKLCTDVAAFQAQAAALEAESATGSLATVRSAVSAVKASLDTLQADAAKLPDKVNGHLVRDDLATAASTYSALDAALAAANPTDPNALQGALTSVLNKEGQAFTQATGRLDAYTKKVCGLVVNNPTTTTTPLSTTTTVPTGATTTAAPVVGPVATTTSVAPAATTSVAPAATTTTIP